ncbi:hypothetical protein IFR05_014993 [Cadophora sp. M221]|nr:hypothetical protein IFR05_014993 [Cadophora sp. M221]
MQLTALTQLLTLALMATMPIAQAAPVDVAQADVALAPRHHKGAGGAAKGANANPASTLAGLFGAGKGAAKNAKRHHKGAGGAAKGANANPASTLAGLFGAGKGAAKNAKRHHKGAGGAAKGANANPASTLAGLFGAGKGN